MRLLIAGMPGAGLAQEINALVWPSPNGVGVLYDWTQEGRSKIYANWGRFYESIPMDINNRAFGGEARIMEWVTKGAAQQGTFNGNPLSSAAGGAESANEVAATGVPNSTRRRPGSPSTAARPC